MFFVIEHNTRPDGNVNTSETARSTFASALSLYHDRYSKLCVSTQFTRAAIMLVDADLNVIQQDNVETQYTEE